MKPWLSPVLWILALLTGETHGADSPIHLPVLLPAIDVGVRHILPPIHVMPNLAIDHPVVHPLRDMYQEDQRYAKLFSETGQSEICGPTSMANALMYLRTAHAPAFPFILQNSVPSGSADPAYVNTLFVMCKTDRDNGTYADDLSACAQQALSQGHYSTSQTYDRGMSADLPAETVAPQPGDLLHFSETTYHAGDSAQKSDHAVILLFGWYHPQWDGLKLDYTRVGGHFVALAGYDSMDPKVFYVSNPLVEYKGPLNYSKIVLNPLPLQADPPYGFSHLWQTEDLVGGSLAVLEDMIVILPGD